MSNLQNSTAFCLFCYKSIPYANKVHKGSFNINKFVKIFHRFLRRSEENPLFDVVSAELLDCCNKCEEIVIGFCDSYTQLEAIEMKLDFMLDKLVEKINYANKVPARWIHVNKVLEEMFPNDPDNTLGNQTLVRNFRQNLANASHQRLGRLYPRVVLNKTENIVQEAKPVELAVNINVSTSQNMTNGKVSNRNGYQTKVCPKCKKTLQSCEGFIIHMESHKDKTEWEYKCRYCFKKFTYKTNLIVHLRQHTGARPYKCRLCKAGYRYRSNWTVHMRRKHMNEQELEEELKKRWIGVSVKDKLESDFDHTDSGENKDNQCFTENITVNLSTSENIIKTTTNDLIEDTKTGYDDMPELDEHTVDTNHEDHSEKESIAGTNMETKESNTIFEDPLIEIKMENQSVVENRDFTAENYLTKKLPMLAGYSEDAVKSFGKNQCLKCGKAFKNGYVLKVHTEYHKDPKDWKWQCKKCGKKFTTKLNLQAHMKAHTKKYQHEVKNEKDVGRAEIEIMKSDVSNPALNQELTMLNEQQGRRGRYGLRKHRTIRYSNVNEIDSDDDNYSRDNACQTDTITKNNSNVKKRNSVNPKTPKLKMKKTRRKKSGIAGPRSKKSSSGSKPFVLECEICTRKFTSFLNKEYHFKKCHDLAQKLGKQLSYKCNRTGCSAYFLTKLQLNKHIRIEHEEKRKQILDEMKKRFGCPKCDKRFAHRSTRDVHMEYHKDPSEWKWECEICGKKSATEFKLKEHVRVHTKEKPFKCRFCKEQFKFTPKLNEHLKLKHADEEEVKAEIYGTTIDVIRENTRHGIVETGVENLCEKDGGDMNENERQKTKVNKRNNLLERKGYYYGDGTLVEFEELD